MIPIKAEEGNLGRFLDWRLIKTELCVQYVCVFFVFGSGYDKADKTDCITDKIMRKWVDSNLKEDSWNQPEKFAQNR